MSTLSTVNILKKYLLPYLLIVWPLMFTGFILLVSGHISFSYSGFGVDKDNNVYIGKESAIEVYDENNSLVRTVSPMTSRGYAFTIIDGDKIYLSTASTAYTMDLYGNVMAEEDDSDTAIYNSLSRKKRGRFESCHHVSYYLRSSFGRLSVERKDGKIVYQMPLFDYIVKIMMILCGISMFIMVPIVIFKSRREDCSQDPFTRHMRN